MAHDHDPRHGRSGNRRRLALALGLAAGYTVVEVVGGLLTNSLALLADAGHMLSDVAALALSLFAAWVAERPPTPRRTYGYYRAEILAALANGATLIAVSLFIFVEAYHRLRHPPEVMGPGMLAVAVGGLAVNLTGLWQLHGGRGESLNVHGAWLHVLTDALGNIKAIVAAGLIWAFGWAWADPVASVLIGLLVIYSSWRLLAESASVLMESACRGIDVDEVRRAMKAVPGGGTRPARLEHHDRAGLPVGPRRRRRVALPRRPAESAPGHAAREVRPRPPDHPDRAGGVRGGGGAPVSRPRR